MLRIDGIDPKQSETSIVTAGPSESVLAKAGKGQGGNSIGFLTA